VNPVADRLEAVRERIRRAGGSPESVTVVAVTKGRTIKEAKQAVEAGIVDLAENYAPELLEKARALADAPVTWHFIGNLQRNKVKVVAPLAKVIQSIWRWEVAEEVSRRAPQARIFVQVNLDAFGPSSSIAPTGRGGCLPEVAPSLVERCRGAGLDVVGLMAVGPHGGAEAAREGFRTVARLAGELGLREVSIGMSEDLEVAVQEGSTMLRLGRVLFEDWPFR